MYGLRIGTEEEFEALRPLRKGIYATCTDTDGRFGSPEMRTVWADANGEPLCAMVTRGFPVGGDWHEGQHTFYVTPPAKEPDIEDDGFITVYPRV